jgi:hypothetical protein
MNGSVGFLSGSRESIGGPLAKTTLRIASTATAIVLLGCLTCHSFAQPPLPEVCDLAMKRDGLTLFAVYGVEVGDGERRIENVRVGGGAEDELLWFCPGSSGIIPSDPCTLKLTLASSGEKYTLEEQRLHVVKYHDAFYAVTGWRESEKGPTHTDVYRLESSGFKKMCSLVEKPNRTVGGDAHKGGARPSP